MNDDGRQWPRIYLTYQDGSYEQPVLWCQDRIDDSDIEYVNVAAFNAQAERVADLEEQIAEIAVYSHEIVILNEARTRIAELEALVKAFQAFNAPLLRAYAEEEPGVWDYLQEDDDETQHDTE